MSSAAAVSRTEFEHLELVHRGKVRDSYALGDDKLLIVATDRLSAYDVVLPDPIPGKGQILTAISNFWFDLTAGDVRNHQTDDDPADYLRNDEQRAAADGRAVVVKRLRPLPIEAVVRGYLIGSGYKDYQRDGRVCGIKLPAGLQLAERLPEAIFTPATKAAAGEHDENIDLSTAARLVGNKRAQEVKSLALMLYAKAVAHAAARGIIIADTKFEFGLDRDDNIVLMDEVLTPDSSRFWPAADYEVGRSPRSYDKQFVRDYLDTLDWDKTAPGPRLPQDIIDKTRERYLLAKAQLLADS